MVPPCWPLWLIKHANLSRTRERGERQALTLHLRQTRSDIAPPGGNFTFPLIRSCYIMRAHIIAVNVKRKLLDVPRSREITFQKIISAETLPAAGYNNSQRRIFLSLPSAACPPRLSFARSQLPRDNLFPIASRFSRIPLISRRFHQ